jgi:hypothetical protein
MVGDELETQLTSQSTEADTPGEIPHSSSISTILSRIHAAETQHHGRRIEESTHREHEPRVEELLSAAPAID